MLQYFALILRCIHTVTDMPVNSVSTYEMTYYSTKSFVYKKLISATKKYTALLTRKFSDINFLLGTIIFLDL